MMLGRLAFSAGAALLVLGAGCGESGRPAGPSGSDDGGPGPYGSEGERVYSEPLADGNTFACATCHAIEEPAPDGLTRPGHPIGDATRRPSYKNGRVTELLEAVNTCVTDWMNASAFTDGDTRWLALRDYLESTAPEGEADPIEIRIVEPPADLSGGDPDEGRRIFDSSCAVCHGEGAVGTERAPPLVGADLEAAYVARRVRTSGDSPVYEGLTGGIMPFWGTDRLPDEDLRHVVAFAVEVSAPVMGDGGMPPSDGGMPPSDAGAGPDSGCGSSHPSVGHVAELSTDFHGVMGTATIVDDCTIVIEDFHYDGTGIDVRIYGGLGGDYDSGFAISDDLIRSGGYSGETLRLTLPSDRTLDDLDGVSVWCVAVGVSFGDGMFAAP